MSTDTAPFLSPVPGYDNLFEIDGEALQRAIYEKHPELVGYVPAATCCRGCKVEDIRADLGPDAAADWEALYWYGLLDS